MEMAMISDDYIYICRHNIKRCLETSCERRVGLQKVGGNISYPYAVAFIKSGITVGHVHWTLDLSCLQLIHTGRCCYVQSYTSMALFQ